MEELKIKYKNDYYNLLLGGIFLVICLFDAMDHEKFSSIELMDILPLLLYLLLGLTSIYSFIHTRDKEYITLNEDSIVIHDKVKSEINIKDISRVYYNSANLSEILIESLSSTYSIYEKRVSKENIRILTNYFNSRNFHIKNS